MSTAIIPENVLQRTMEWFAEAVPTPTDKNLHVQLGAHFEEVGEMVETLVPLDQKTAELLINAEDALRSLATHLKTTEGVITVTDPKAFLDGVADQLVTAAGSGYMMSMDVVGALGEVNRSNWSKFQDGIAVFDENGKIKKGPDYSKPNLDPFL